nr:hypothetical protein [Tanacetum cinerariifolium]
DAFDPTNIRAAVTQDGATFYAVGGNSTVRYLPLEVEPGGWHLETQRHYWWLNYRPASRPGRHGKRHERKPGSQQRQRPV